MTSGGVDVDATKSIRAGRSPVAEQGLDELVAQAVADGTLHAMRHRASKPSTGPTRRWCVRGRRRRRGSGTD
jgi:UDP-glucose 6-dehydrogenase